ncbi:Menaquinone biosynthesis methyltransferase [Histomonas meleagridis]|uniref:Menaquinone biosynthesis methyltransferase n=1 Tax=Histomonas meleagridis TaxID=135588 RepID=UPI00355A7D43|nr:Menaquinone biosynthesis methyltransferase [Histomonas meleagridis]KAH0799962.1 Menaquinone biosynthesis methyltransferase [Histomonas meleagridis]
MNEASLAYEALEAQLDNIIPYTAIKYDEQTYWEEKYLANNDEEFEWYLDWEQFKDSIAKFLRKGGAALDVGCGNSSLAADLQKDFFQKVYGIDISQNVIKQMKETYQGNNNLVWIVGNILKTNFPSNSFDAIFEKGTIDSLLCSKFNTKKAKHAIAEISRILKPSGVFFSISHGEPQFREALFKTQENLITLVQTEKVLKPSGSGYYYIYILRKL